MTVEVNVVRKAVEVKWDPSDYEGDVKVIATGAEGDVHNTAAMPNDGLAVLSYPDDFVGQSDVKVTGVDGTEVDEGTITIGAARATNTGHDPA